MIIAKQYDNERCMQIQEKFKICPLVAQHLAGLNIQDAWIDGLLNSNYSGQLPEPNTFVEMKEIIKTIIRHIKKGSTIYVYGDYDVDGMTSTAIMVMGLKAAGASVDYLIPHPDIHGRGISPIVANDILANLGEDLVITVDTGVTDVRGVDTLIAGGVEVIITDHHLPEETLPNCHILDSKVTGEIPFTNIAGCGVALFLIYALFKELDIKNRSIVEHLFQLVAVGTITDAVPIDKTNKLLIEKGLYSMRKNPAPFIAALYADQFNMGKPINYESISFYIAPPLTAAGKSGRHDIVMDILTASSVEEAVNVVSYLNTIRQKRKKLTAAILKEAERQVRKEDIAENNLIFIVDNNWDKSVLGVVASKLVDKYGVPVVLCGYTSSGYGGSARSPYGQDIHACFASMPEGYLTSFGGHKNSCGLAFKGSKLNKVLLHAFRYGQDTFKEYIEDTVVSAIIEPKDVTLENVIRFNDIAPFCNVVPKPIFGFVGCKVEVDMILKKTHTKFKVFDEDGTFIIGLLFNQVVGSEGDVLDNVDIVGTMSINHYQGKASIQLIINKLTHKD